MQEKVRVSDSLFNCLQCQNVNPLTASQCQQCGASLRASRASYYLELAAAALAQGEYDEASRTLMLADGEMVALSPYLRQQHGLAARAFMLQGQIYYNKGQLADASLEYDLARQQLEGQPGGEPLLAAVLKLLGNVCYYQHDAARALTCYERSSRLAAGVGDWSLAAQAVNNIGTIYSNRNDTDNAILYYTRGVDYAERSRDPAMTASAYRRLAILYIHNGPASHARDYAAKALSLRDRVTNLGSRASLLCEAASVYMISGDYELAARYLHEADSLAQQGGQVVKEAVAIYQIELARATDDAAGWSNLIDQHFAGAVTQPLLKAEVALQLATYYAHQGDVAACRHQLANLDQLEQSGQLADEHRAALTHARALLHAALGEWPQADGCFREVLADPTRTPYQQATIWQQYATMLDGWAAADPATDQTATATARQAAADLYNRLGLPQAGTQRRASRHTGLLVAV